VLFLIEYDRAQGCVAKMTSFDDSEREAAENARLGLELRLHKEGVQREIVLLEAASEDALRVTHRRYFENLGELAKPSTSST